MRTALGKRPLGIPRWKLYDNIKMELTETGCENVS
jgi:hypothetical protein